MLKISIIQSELVWQDREANLIQFNKCIEDIKEPTDIIILPEMFSTGFSMNPGKYAESPDGAAVKWMMDIAAKKNAAVTGSLMIHENGSYFNRLFFVLPDATIFTYNKRHLFRMADEQLDYQAGKEKLLIEYKGYKIFPIICYDLRFPVWLRRTANENYDLMIIVANWPERRNTHWKTLIQARAIENQCWVAAVNRIGEDGNQINHSGDSALINPKGEIIAQYAHVPFVETHVIDREAMEQYRLSFNVLEDADDFKLIS